MRRLAIFLFLSALAAIAIAAGLFAAGQTVQGPEIEQFLRRSRFTGQEPLGSGVTHSLKVRLQQDDVVRYGVLKTVDQKRPGAALNAKGEIEIDFQDSYRTEIAAYELDKLIGLGMVPATVERTSPYDNLPASLQLWVESSMSEAKRRETSVIPPDATSWSEQLSKMYLFDALIYNTDRHPNNLLITEDFEIRLIDHSRSFRPIAEIRNKEELSRFSRSLVKKIEELDKNVVGDALGNYLSLQQLDGLIKRRQLILDYIDTLVATNGERAVLYP